MTNGETSHKIVFRDKLLNIFMGGFFMSEKMLVTQALDVKKKVEELEEKRNTLLTELDTQIKVSNATTFIEVA